MTLPFRTPETYAYPSRTLARDKGPLLYLTNPTLGITVVLAIWAGLGSLFPGLAFFVLLFFLAKRNGRKFNV